MALLEVVISWFAKSDTGQISQVGRGGIRGELAEP